MTRRSSLIGTEVDLTPPIPRARLGGAIGPATRQVVGRCNRAVRDDDDIAMACDNAVREPRLGRTRPQGAIDVRHCRHRAGTDIAGTDIAGTNIAGTNDLEGCARARSGRALPVSR
jgi:hypothetical protein